MISRRGGILVYNCRISVHLSYGECWSLSTFSILIEELGSHFHPFTPGYIYQLTTNATQNIIKQVIPTQQQATTISNMKLNHVISAVGSIYSGVGVLV